MYTIRTRVQKTIITNKYEIILFIPRVELEALGYAKYLQITLSDCISNITSDLVPVRLNRQLRTPSRTFICTYLCRYMLYAVDKALLTAYYCVGRSIMYLQFIRTYCQTYYIIITLNRRMNAIIIRLQRFLVVLTWFDRQP